MKRLGLGVVLAVAGSLAMAGSASAQATYVNAPESYTVGGSSAMTHVQIDNQSGLGTYSPDSIHLHAACVNQLVFCTGGVEPGIFSFGPAGQGVAYRFPIVGDPPFGTDGCVGIWSVFEKQDDPGHFILYPPGVGGVSLPADTFCVVSFPGHALAMPPTDTEPDPGVPGVQTRLSATARDGASYLGGTDTTTVIPAAPVTPTTPATPAAPLAGAAATGLRAQALAKCKKKKSKSARKKCRNRAAALPV